MTITFIDTRRDPEHVYYGRAVALDRAREMEDPEGAVLAVQAVITHDAATLAAGAAGRAGLEPVPDASPEAFEFFDAKTGQRVVAWRMLCRRRSPTHAH